MKVIKEIREDRNNNESVVRAGVYQLADGTYEWLTYTRSGECKKLATAMRKAGLE